MRVLLVEDNRIDELVFLKNVEALAATYHLTVTVARNMAEAEQAVVHSDLVVLDLNLPDSDYLTTLGKLVSDQRPVVISTILDNPDDMVHAGYLGAAGYLSKAAWGKDEFTRVMCLAIGQARRLIEQLADKERRRQSVLGILGEAKLPPPPPAIDVTLPLPPDVPETNAERVTGAGASLAKVGKSLTGIADDMNAAAGKDT